MIVEAFSQEKNFHRFYALIGEGLCSVYLKYALGFEDVLAEPYATIHRYDTRNIRSIASFFAFLLVPDSLTWNVLGIVHLAEEKTSVE